VSYIPNATAASLLGFLHDGPLTGWELVETAELTIGDFWSLTRSQVYRELGKMAQEGLIVAGETGPRDRLPYALTTAGREAFAAWIDQEPGSETIRFPLLLTVAFGRHLDENRLVTYLNTHRRQHEQRLVTYTDLLAQMSTDDDPHVVATLSFGVTYERAVLDWFDSLPETLGISEDKKGIWTHESTDPE
jgi:DNA-binding PadR family transcriptional regulator